MDGSPPLASVRILDVAGPHRTIAGWLLAMLGADVEVVSSATPADAVAADVVIAGGSAGAGGTRTVTCAISPFGESGPYATWRASDLVLQAMGGMLAASGMPGEPPLPVPGDQAHHQGGIFGAIGIVAALLARERTGRGQHVDVSLQAAVAASLEHAVARFLHDGTVTTRSGRLHWTGTFRTGPTRDGWAAYSTTGDWTTLVEWLKAHAGSDDLANPPYEDDAYRRAHAAHVFDVIDRWGRSFEGAWLETEAQRRRLAFAAVRPREALRVDPQLVARRFFVDAPTDAWGAMARLEGLPFRLGPAACPVARTGPEPGWRAPGSGEEPSSPASRMPAPVRRPLDGMRVADFGWLVAGPTATAILADLGAEVIKVEHPRTLDAGDRRSGFTGALNRGKRSIVLDLGTAEGRAAAERLALSADVVLDNFSARVMEQLHLDPATLRARRPDLVCIRMTGFGTSGPDRDQVSFGPTLQARAGYTALMTATDGTPVGLGFSYADVASGHLAALAILAALWRRRHTGEGASIDFSQFEAIASLLGPGAPGSRHSLEGIYRCAGTDRWLAVSIESDDDWRRFAAVAGHGEWVADPRFLRASDRLRNRSALDAAVSSWTETLDADAAMALLQAGGIAAGRVADARDLCERDPQLRRRGWIAVVPSPEGDVRIAGLPFTLSDAATTPLGPGPRLGEHTDHVLATTKLARQSTGA